jgi:AcrR family transcriptional regulator
VKALLEATEAVSRRVGFAAATTKEIADVAEVSAGTLYRYFPSKDALLIALVRRQWELGVQDFGSRIALVVDGDFAEILEKVVRLAFDMVASRIGALGEMQIESDQALHMGPELISHAAALVRGALERRRSDLAVEDVEVASLIVVRSVVFLARVGVRDYGELVSSGRYPEEIARMVRRYLLLR